MARQFGLRHEFISTAELERPEYRSNPVNRCYYCKTELYTTLAAMASARGVAVVADGSNADDRGDYRPGRQAARENGVRSPLDEVGLTKPEIRELARHLGMSTWDEPASACLSSRVPYHSEITHQALRMIERAEDGIREPGLPGVPRAALRRRRAPGDRRGRTAASPGAGVARQDRGRRATRPATPT